MNTTATKHEQTQTLPTAHYEPRAIRMGSHQQWTIFDTRTNTVAHWMRDKREATRWANWLNGTHTSSGAALPATQQ